MFNCLFFEYRDLENVKKSFKKITVFKMGIFYNDGSLLN